MYYVDRSESGCGWDIRRAFDGEYVSWHLTWRHAQDACARMNTGDTNPFGWNVIGTDHE